jgi:hypothetical protein
MRDLRHERGQREHGHENSYDERRRNGHEVSYS